MNQSSLFLPLLAALSAIKSLAQEMKRPVFIVEFGIASKGEEEAVWVFDLKTQDKNWNITSDNSRAYMLKLVSETNHRWNKIFAFRQP